MHWAQQYVGQPYIEGEHDCAAFAARVQREVFRREIFLPTARAGLRGNARMIDTLAADYAVPTTTPRDGDAVLMVSRGRLSHVGIYCLFGNVPYVLHAMKNAGMVVLHRIRDLDNQGLTLEGYYQWRAH